ncbi:MAG: response regulator [bacterium]
MKRKTILIVEDDRSFRKGLAFELIEIGHKVVEASDGKEAIEQIQKNYFDLVISDLLMPEVDGLEVYDHVKRVAPETRFILLTAFHDSERAKTARTLLQENYIRKSGDHDFLFQRINQILE